MLTLRIGSTFVGLVVMLVGLPLPGYVAKSLNTVQEEKMKKVYPLYS